MQVAPRKLLRASWSLQVAPCKLLCANFSVQVAPCKLLCASCSVQVALCKLLCASCSAQVALCKLLCVSCSAQVALGKALCANWSVQVALRKLLCANWCVQLALRKLLCASCFMQVAPCSLRSPRADQGGIEPVTRRSREQAREPRDNSRGPKSRKNLEFLHLNRADPRKGRAKTKLQTKRRVFAPHTSREPTQNDQDTTSGRRKTTHKIDRRRHQTSLGQAGQTLRNIRSSQHNLSQMMRNKQKQHKHPSNQHHRRYSSTTRHTSLTGVGVQYAYKQDADLTIIQSNIASFQSYSLTSATSKGFDDSNVHPIGSVFFTVSVL